MKLDSAELKVIRELLSDAFNSGEINTLAFDLFQPVYRDFSPAMTRSVKIETIVGHASDKGGIPELLFYVEKENPYQYASYAAKLAPIWQKLNATSSREEATKVETRQETDLAERKQRLSSNSESK